MAALRIVRYFNGGVTLSEVLSSARLMQIATREMRREQEALAIQTERDSQDWAFANHAAAFFAEGVR